MKCEICNNADANQAIFVKGGKDDEERELYVCDKCARRETIKSSKRLSSVRADDKSRSKTSDKQSEESGFSENDKMSDGGSAQIYELLNNITQSLKNGIRLNSEIIELNGPSAQENKPSKKKKERKLVALPLAKKAIDSAYLMRGSLHLEGLFLIGEIDATKRSAAALNLELRSDPRSAVKSAAHLFKIMHSSKDKAIAERFLAAVIQQEQNARERLMDEMSLLFMDTVCRSLAILKNCRLLGASELLDFLSSLRLAALAGILKGMSLEKIESMMENVDFSEDSEEIPIEEREDYDAKRANQINALFEDVLVKELD